MLSIGKYNEHIKAKTKTMFVIKGEIAIKIFGCGNEGCIGKFRFSLKKITYKAGLLGEMSGPRIHNDTLHSKALSFGAQFDCGIRSSVGLSMFY